MLNITQNIRKNITRKTSGFTLIEAIVYIAISALILFGLIASTYPLFTGTERISQNVLSEGESLFILRKIGYSLGSAASISTPAEGANGDTLDITTVSGDSFSFTLDSGVVTFSENAGSPLPLNNSRIAIENFNVEHIAPTAGGEPRQIIIEFDAENDHIGPIQYNLYF